MRIGIACHPTYGGSGAAATELGRHLVRRGHSVHIISTDRPFRLNRAAYQENLYLHQVESVKYPVLKSELYTLSCSVKMAQIVRDEGLDILHSHYAVPYAVSAMLARQLCPESGVKLVTTLHGTDITLVGSHPAFAPVVRMALHHSDAVVSVSHWLSRETCRLFGLCESIRVIHNFVDTAEFRRRAESRCFRASLARPEEKVVLHISNFRPVKRTADVVRVFRRIVDETPAVLLMVGDGPDRDAAHTLSHELGVGERVHFLGLQDDIAGFLAIGDLLLFPSEYESFGLAVLEAMASEVPVVCSNGGGLPEVMAQGETGYMCPVGDVEEMAARAVEILRDSEKARRMGQAGRARAEERFNPEQALEAHEELYESLFRAGT